MSKASGVRCCGGNRWQSTKTSISVARQFCVTGSGRNIGRAIILEFAARGANVIINSRTNEAEARSVEHEAQALGAKTLVVMGTAGELQTVEEMKRRAEDKFGRVDIYVSNAARRRKRRCRERSSRAGTDRGRAPSSPTARASTPVRQ